ncbi:MAG: hypothetical protein OXF73_09860, partial [Gammaproteobacteria bacterium]|nr:hypothetical protein [Gammaproteobacteria bacterium]
VLFGKHAFRRSMAMEKVNRKSVINIFLFDVFSTLFSVMREKTVDNNAKEIVDRVVELVNDEVYAYTITYSTSSTSQVKSRFKLTMGGSRGVSGIGIPQVTYLANFSVKLESLAFLEQDQIKDSL